MELKRRKFQGVLNILSFNRHFYVGGVIVLALLLSVFYILKIPIIWSFILGGAFAYGLLIPLVVSAYVYDFSGYYKFDWLATLGFTKDHQEHLININAGFDETSYILKKHFPKSDLKVFDFYDAERHTEPAIVRARKVSSGYPNTTQISSDRIPSANGSADLVFLLSAAHEIRSYCEKVAFLKECKRVCKTTGKVVLVEHLRDFPNFLAFSVGFTHFFSRRTWVKAFKEAGFSSCQETKFTPFMSIFNFQP